MSYSYHVAANYCCDAASLAMFQLPAINVPILGFVENMAWYSPQENSEEKIYLFGQEGTKNMAADFSLPLIAQVPLIQGIREAGDVGRPAILQEETTMGHYLMEFIGNFEREMRMLPFRPQKTPTT
jgi:ATP-binding protein involved in chromosome partitioning